MTSIFKTAFLLLTMISMAMGGFYMKKSADKSSAALRIAQIAPIIIGNNGSIRFPQRVPTPEAVFQFQMAVRTENVTALNDLLIKHRFYLLPGNSNP